jgi:pyruvate ferredoxin oxidoreductase beta subunit
LSVCPTGWRLAPELTIRAGRLAVQTGIFPLYEIEKGEYTLNFDFPQLRPVEDYLKLQGRFRHLTKETIAQIQERVTAKYAKLKEKTTGNKY